MNRFVHIVVLQLLFLSVSMAQSVLDFPAYQASKWNIGIENNFAGVITYQPKDRYFFEVRQSLYNSPLKNQLIEGDLGYQVFVRDHFFIAGKLGALTNYQLNRNRLWVGFDAQLEFEEFKIAYQGNYVALAEGANPYDWYNNIGVFIQAWDKVGFLVNWGHTPSFFFDERSVNFSVFFEESRLSVKPSFQLPESGNLKHSRILISFVYAIVPNEVEED